MIKYFRRMFFKSWGRKFKNSNPHLYKLFSKFIENGEKLRLLKIIHWELTEQKQSLYLLPKNIPSYDTGKNLLRDIEKYLDIDSHKKYLYRKGIEKIWNLLSKEDKKKLVVLVIKKKIPVIKTPTQLNLFVRENKLNLREIKTPDYKIPEDAKEIFSDENIRLIKLESRKAVSCFNKKWCIKNKEDWNGYVGKGYQYVLIRLAVLHWSDQHMVSFSINKRKDKIKYAYDQANEKVKLNDKYLKYL